MHMRCRDFLETLQNDNEDFFRGKINDERVKEGKFPIITFQILYMAGGETLPVPETSRLLAFGNATPIMLAAGKQMEVLMTEGGSKEVDKIKKIIPKFVGTGCDHIDLRESGITSESRLPSLLINQVRLRF